MTRGDSMLDGIRKNKSNVVYTILILAVVAVMVVYNVDQNDKNTRGDKPAAWVNGEVITTREFQQELGFRVQQYQSMFGGQFDEKMLTAFKIPQATLDEMVRGKLFKQQSDKLGFRTSDPELVSFITKIPQLQTQGKFDKDKYSKIPNRGLEEMKWRERLQVQKFQSYLQERAKSLPSQLIAESKLKQTKIDLEFAQINFAALADKQKLSNVEIQQFVSNANPKDLQDYYQAHLAEYTDPAQFQYRQIRAGFPYGATDEQKKKAKERLNSLVAQKITKDNFAEIAKQHSDDEFAGKGGLVEWTKKPMIDAAVAISLEALSPGQVSSIIDGSFGYFVIAL